MSNVELATAYVSIVPTTKGIQANVAKELGGVSEAAEQEGKKAGGALKDSIGKGLAGIKEKAGGLLGDLGIGAAVAGAFGGALQASQNQGTLAAKLGLSPSDAAQAAKVAGSVYASNWGESLSEVDDAVAQVKQSLTGVNDPATLKDITTKALALKQTFGTDTQASINAVAQLLRTGVAKNASEAFDLITTGEQNGADKAGDLLDTFNEYGTQFRKLGVDGPTALGLIQQGLQAGARDSDLVADSIKEFSIRAVDGSATTAQGFALIGLNAKTLSEQIGKGGTSASAGLNSVLASLRAIKDPVKQAQAASDLFGTQSEDLGKALFALNPATASAAPGLDKLSGSTDRLVTAAGSASSPLDNLKRSAMGTLTQLGTRALPILQPIFTIVGKLGPEVVTLALAFAALAVVTKVVNGVKAFNEATKIATVATKIWSGVQAAFNLIMAANPLVLIIGGLVLLGAALFVAYQKSATFRDIVQGAFAVVKTVALDVVSFFTVQIPGAFETVVQAANNAINWVRTYWPLLLAIITGPIGIAVLLVVKNWDTIKGAAITAFNWVRDHWPLILAIITGPIGLAVLAVSTFWGQITGGVGAAKDAVVNGLTGIVSFVTGLPGKIASAAKGLWDGLTGGLADTFESVAGGFVGTIKRVINDALQLPWKIPKISLGFGQHIGGQTLIPSFAKGGIVPATPGGVLIRVAEAGQDEEIRPLPKGGRPGGGDEPPVQINQHIYTQPGQDPGAIALDSSRRIARDLPR